MIHTVYGDRVKWYWKLSMKLVLDISVVNAYVTYKKATRFKIGIREFRENIAKSLVVYFLNEGMCNHLFNYHCYE